MDKKISKTLSKISKDIAKVDSPNISTAIKSTLGDPNCPYCGGVGYIRRDVEMNDPQFGRLEICVCRSAEVAEGARSRLFELSRLDSLNHLTFENFDVRGNKNAKIITAQDIQNLQTALDATEIFSRAPKNWLLLEGGYGCGKTHLAAAIANYAVSIGTPTLFITVPDLLDSLRFAFSDPETTFESRFEEVRNADLLVLDDFGTQNATGWGQEKLFQIMNYRYINKLPTVITTNLSLDEIESRIRSRLQDDEFVTHIRITAPDYRRPTQTSNPGISMLTLPEIMEMKLENFETRENELGKEVIATIKVFRQESYGQRNKEKETLETRRFKVTQADIKTLHDTVSGVISFAEKPQGWLVLLGGSFCGKTHLAAAIGNYQIALGGQATMIEVSELLDYLRQTFNPKSDVSFDRRFNEIKSTPLLILDDLKESGSSSVWAENKLYQILTHRFYAHLPTVITSVLKPELFESNYPSIWNRINDITKSKFYVIDMPPYQKMTKKTPSMKKGK
jgi:DNA replication protein DnaC